MPAAKNPPEGTREGSETANHRELTNFGKHGLFWGHGTGGALCVRVGGVWPPRALVLGLVMLLGSL